MRRKIPVAGKRGNQLGKSVCREKFKRLAIREYDTRSASDFTQCLFTQFVPAVYSGNWLSKKETGFAT